MQRYSAPVRLVSLEHATAELRRLESLVNALIDGKHEILTKAPTSPEIGDVVWADGTTWNPGSGAGLYEYRSSTWNKL